MWEFASGGRRARVVYRLGTEWVSRGEAGLGYKCCRLGPKGRRALARERITRKIQDLYAHCPRLARLARLEGRIALATLLARLPALQLAVPAETLRWRGVPILRGLHHLPVEWRRDKG